MSSPLNKNVPRINTLSGKVRWKGIQKTSRNFFRPGKQDSSAKMLEKEFQKAEINKFKRNKGQEIVQNMITEGRITKDKARELMKGALGYAGSENERFTEGFKDISEYKAMQKNQERAQTAKREPYSARNKKSKSAPDKKVETREQKIRTGAPTMSPGIKTSSNRNATPETTQPNKEKKASSVWEILNKQQHSNIFPGNDQKAA